MSDGDPRQLRWARLRFSIIGPLLAAPPQPGELAGRSSPRSLPRRGDTRPAEMSCASRPRQSSGCTIPRAARPTHSAPWSARCRATRGTRPERLCGARAGHRPAARRPPGLELPASSRQPRRPRQARPVAGPDAGVRDGASLHEGPWTASSAEAPGQGQRDRGRPRGRRAPMRSGTSMASGTMISMWARDRCSRPRGARSSISLGVVDDCSRLCCQAPGMDLFERTPRRTSSTASPRASRSASCRGRSFATTAAQMKSSDRPGLRATRHRAVPDGAAQALEQMARCENSGVLSRGGSCPCSRASRSSPSNCSNRATHAWVEQECH